MLTKEQEAWINHLSDTNTVSVVPFDPSCETRFLSVKKMIQGTLGLVQKIEHRGASSLGISGQDEIDIYIPVLEKEFNQIVEKITPLFGQPKSHYVFKRARFVTNVEGKHTDIFVINKESDDWKRSEKFDSFLRSYPKILDEYRILKEEASWQSVREYYRTKIQFINRILQESQL